MTRAPQPSIAGNASLIPLRPPAALDELVEAGMLSAAETIRGLFPSGGPGGRGSRRTLPTVPGRGTRFLPFSGGTFALSGEHGNRPTLEEVVFSE